MWEITRRCHLRCAHCLLDGGEAQGDELSTQEALQVVGQLAALGVQVVTLTGGEPLLRADWRRLAGAVRDAGLGLRFSGTGCGLDAETVAFLEGLGAQSFAVSIDGLRSTHDGLRRGERGGGRSSFDEAVAALDRLGDTSIRSSVITTVTARNLEELAPVHRLLVEHGVQQWMIQLAHRTGRLRRPYNVPDDEQDREAPPDTVAPLAPGDLQRLVAFLVQAGEHPRLRPLTHNTIGYLSELEPRLRRPGRSGRLGFWTGCQCGVTTVGIAPNGDVKGCANQVGAPFVVGNLRVEELAAIWRDRDRWHWLAPSRDRAGGRCAECALFEACGGGCTALAYASSGALFDNPYCVRQGAEGDP